MLVGIFTIVSAFRGAHTFNSIREVHLKQYRAAELMKQRALDVIAIYYLLATDQDEDILMAEMQRYDELVKSFDEAKESLAQSFQANDLSPEKTKVLGLLGAIKFTFDELNFHSREMTFSMMEGKKQESAAKFKDIDSGVKKFKAELDELENIVNQNLEDEANKAYVLLKNTTWLGIIITVLAIFITLGLIYYLMNFLSISLLPISNLMHNMRQAVFSIDKKLNIIAPVSNFSRTVLGEDIVGKDVREIIYSDADQKSQAYTQNIMALETVFDADDVQWMLMEDNLLRQVKRNISVDGVNQEKILKLTYTPLKEKDLVQNIMIVAEDVTDMERLRAEALKKQGELEVIEGVVGITGADLETFLTDGQADIQKCRKLLAEVETNRDSRLIVLRVLHTLKGNARMYGLNTISEATHLAENVFVEIDKNISGGEKLQNESRLLFLANLAKIDDVLSLHNKFGRKLYGIKDLYSESFKERLSQAFGNIELLFKNTNSDSIGKIWEQFIVLREEVLKVTHYFENSSVEALFNGLVQRDMASNSQREDFLKQVSSLLSNMNTASSENEERMIEVSASNFKEISNLVMQFDKAKAGDSQPVIERLQKIVRHAFDYPIRTICQKMEPMVFDISKRLGKKLNYKVAVDNFTVSRENGNLLRDALVHLIRNSIDHGIETPEDRLTCNKPAEAVLEIGAFRKNNKLEIVVRDDGRGINTSKLVEKAISMKVLDQNKVSSLTTQEQLDLVFVPNLSSKEEVTAISGRGVGLDAVKNVLEKLGGSISVSSEQGKGTEFRMIINE